MNHPLRIGILGSGQLGRMLLQCAVNYNVETFVMGGDSNAPAAALCHHFTEGDINDYEQVLEFGRGLDVVTIEIEHVNLEALYELERLGVQVYPRPHALEIIKDKGLQKEFYRKRHIPASDFRLITGQDELRRHFSFLPVAQKLRSGGYDGKGVVILRTEGDIHRSFSQPSVIEKLVDFSKEISVIVACNIKGRLAVYPPVEMVFNPLYNLVDYLISPADMAPELIADSQRIAKDVVKALNSPGIFAIEMFLDRQGQILVNETAPRAHNSGHQSIEGNYCSQYDMQMRMLQNMPPGDTGIIKPSLMLNLVGEPGFTGTVKYQGLEQALSIKGVYVHLYGKKQTKPGRKMGHVTILGEGRDELLEKAMHIKQVLKVTGEDV